MGGRRGAEPVHHGPDFGGAGDAVPLEGDQGLPVHPVVTVQVPEAVEQGPALAPFGVGHLGDHAGRSDGVLVPDLIPNEVPVPMFLLAVR